MVLSLANLLDGTRAADTTIAIRGSERLTLRRFRADVAHNAERLRRSRYQCGVLICATSSATLNNAIIPTMTCLSTDVYPLGTIVVNNSATSRLWSKVKILEIGNFF